MKLAKREKYILTAVACLIGAVLLLQLVVFPFFENRRRLRRGITAKQEALNQIVRLSADYKALEKNATGIKRSLAGRKKSFTLFSFLENAAGASNIKSNIKYMKPSEASGRGPFKESLVEMKLEGISLTQLTDYLKRIESPADLVGIRRISIQTNKNESGYLDAVLQVMTYL